MKVILCAIALLLVPPFAALSLAVFAVALPIERVRARRRERALREQLDTALQHVWDLTRQLDALTRATPRTAELFETWN